MKFLPILVAIIFIAAGFTKVLGIKAQKQHFKHWNLPSWFMYLTGTLEVLAGAGLLFDSTQFLSSLLAVGVMTGALITCVVVSDYKRAFLPLSILIALGFILINSVGIGSMTIGFLCLNVLGIITALILWLSQSTPYNKEGEKEILDEETAVTHHFKEVLGVNYHYVTSGERDKPAILFIHGAPESWYAWNRQIIALSKSYFVIAIDMKPYGQTDNDLDGDHSFPHIATEVKVLLDQIGIENFHMVAHDRGVIAADHLLSKEGMEERVSSYIRMQQSFDQPHGKPEPPHHLMGSFIGTLCYKIRFGLWFLYKHSMYVNRPLDSQLIKRLTKEFQFKNIAQAMPLSFKTTSFAKELKDRQDHLFRYMTMPILLLQGRYDPGQHPEEYENSHSVVPDLKVQFIDANHFTHHEAPQEVNEAIIAFLREVESKSETFNQEEPLAAR